MSERLSSSQTCKVAIVGPGGDGKSQFVSMVCGHSIFTVDQSGFSCTEDTHSVDCTIKGQNFRFIDHPSFCVLEEDEQRHLDTIFHSLKEEQSINAICLVFRVTRNRVDLAIEKTLRYVRNLFTTPDVYKHLCLVITFTDSIKAKKEFEKTMLPAINKQIDKLFDGQRNDLGDLPIYFVDSAIIPNDMTRAEKDRFLANVAMMSEIHTTSINRLDPRYELVTEEITAEKIADKLKPFMVTVIRNGVQQKSEEGEMMPVTTYQKVRRLIFESLTPDENGNTTSCRTLGPVGEPWDTEDDSHVRVFKKEYKTRTTILGGIEERYKIYDRNGKCIETSPWIQIAKTNPKWPNIVIGMGFGGCFLQILLLVVVIIL